VWSLLFGFVSIVAVSRLTPPEPEKALSRIFLPLHTPVGEEQRLGDLCAEPQGGQ
jgi:hypothetical protein